MIEAQETAGQLLRQWRGRRRLSQLDLSAEAGISQRHLSFVESGPARPSREMVMRLCEQLDVPLRERNTVLVAAGHAPHYPQHPLDAPALSAAQTVIGQILQGHLPHPALAVNRYWELQAANAAIYALLDDVAPHLLEGTVNVLRLSMHPEGLAPRIVNFAEWRAYILARLLHEVDQTADPRLLALHTELAALPAPAHSQAMRPSPASPTRIAVPLKLKSRHGPLTFLGTTTVFGTAVDVTLSEVAIEAFFPAEPETAAAMTRLISEAG